MEQKRVVEVSLDENAVYVVKDGSLIKLEQPGDGFGKQEINWCKGSVTNYDVKNSYKL